MSIRRSKYFDLGIELGVTAAIIAAVWIAAAQSTSPYISHPWEILTTFRQTWLSTSGEVGADLVPSLERIFGGYAIAVVIGVSFGVMIARNSYLRMLTEPLITFLRSTPPAVLVPLFMALLGIGSLSKIVLIAFVCIWPILLNTTDGVRAIDETVLDTARAFGLSRSMTLRKVILRAALPRIFSGMRVSLSLSLLIVVVAEMVGATNGLGFYVIRAQQEFSIPQMWAGTVLLGLLGLILNLGFSRIERVVISWHYDSKLATDGS